MLGLSILQLPLAQLSPEKVVLLAAVLKAEKSFLFFNDWHSGHIIFSVFSPLVSNSNVELQSSHLYSKIGMFFLP
jgi:hypothetical protein